jgi:hypothetical protein
MHQKLTDQSPSANYTEFGMQSSQDASPLRVHTYSYVNAGRRPVARLRLSGDLPVLVDCGKPQPRDALPSTLKE